MTLINFIKIFGVYIAVLALLYDIVLIRIDVDFELANLNTTFLFFASQFVDRMNFM